MSGEQVEGAVGDDEQLLALYREAIAASNAIHEEIGKLRGELCSVKANEKSNEKAILELERTMQTKLHGEHGNNGVYGGMADHDRRLTHTERRLAWFIGITGSVLSGLAVLTWWAWRMVVAP